jgi:hypothetical protein
MSPWPPVWLMKAPDGRIRGPGTRPAATSLAQTGSRPPASRTVVKPSWKRLLDRVPDTEDVFRQGGLPEQVGRDALDAEVNMSVGEAGQEAVALAVDDLVGANGVAGWPDLVDSPVVDDDVMALERIPSGAVDDRDVTDHEAHHEPPVMRSAGQC